MRHLKRFSTMYSLCEQSNESLDKVFKEELKDFCESSLAYLLDDAAQLEVSDWKDWDEWKVSNDCKITILINPGKRWDEIKDQIIPFLTRLRKKYQISEFNGIKRGTKTDIYVYSYAPYNNVSGIKSYNPLVEYEVKNLINDQISLDKEYEIWEIKLFISGYKQETQPKKSFISKIKNYFKK
jgi:hypothetical protein